MVGKGLPKPPHYLFHPKTHESQLCRDFGARPGHTHALSFDSFDPRHREMARHIVRYSQLKPEWHPAGFGRAVYIGTLSHQPFYIDLIVWLRQLANIVPILKLPEQVEVSMRENSACRAGIDE